MTLKEAFQILNIRSFSLLSLDQSIRNVTSGNKTMEEHRKLVDKKTREVMKLSHLYHPDKTGKSNAQKQHLINHNMLKDKKMLHKSLIVYRLFEDATIQRLINRPTWETQNAEAYIELKEITFWKEQSLLSQSNLYLNARAYLNELLEPAYPLSPDSLASIKETFDQAYKRYTSVYEKK